MHSLPAYNSSCLGGSLKYVLYALAQVAASRRGRSHGQTAPTQVLRLTNAPRAAWQAAASSSHTTTRQQRSSSSSSRCTHVSLVGSARVLTCWPLMCMKCLGSYIETGNTPALWGPLLMTVAFTDVGLTRVGDIDLRMKRVLVLKLRLAKMISRGSKVSAMRASARAARRVVVACRVSVAPEPLPPVINWHLEPRCNYGCKVGRGAAPGISGLGLCLVIPPDHDEAGVSVQISQQRRAGLKQPDTPATWTGSSRRHPRPNAGRLHPKKAPSPRPVASSHAQGGPHCSPPLLHASARWPSIQALKSSRRRPLAIIRPPPQFCFATFEDVKTLDAPPPDPAALLCVPALLAGAGASRITFVVRRVANVGVTFWAQHPLIASSSGGSRPRWGGLVQTHTHTHTHTAPICP